MMSYCTDLWGCCGVLYDSPCVFSTCHHSHPCCRQYWVADMQWTCDSLFLACILKQGTVCLLTRLGEPLLIQTFGSSVEMGPKPYLPLHPLITVRLVVALLPFLGRAVHSA